MKSESGFILIVLFSLLIIPGSANPEDLIWQQTLGGPIGEEWGYSLDATPDGGLIAVGITYSRDANITNAHGNGDLWAVRLDGDGNLIWESAYGGNESDYGLSVKSTADGGSVIVGTTGSYSGDVTGYHGNGDLWVLRLDPSGNSVWQKALGGNQTDEGGDILQTSDGGYTLVGYTLSDDGDATGHHGGGDLWMIRLDPGGNLLWQKTLGGSRRESGGSIIQTSDGGYAITGNSYSSDGDATTNHGSSDVWVVKTDANGNLLWQKSYGGSQLDWGHSLVELPGGDLLVTAVTVSSDGDVSLNHGAGDVWVLRLSPDGTLVWERTYGGTFSDNVWKAELSPAGGVYLVGESFSTDGDGLGNHGDADLWVAEIDGNGTLLWQRSLGGSDYESGAWIRRLADGNLAAVGTTRSSDGDVTGIKGAGDLWIVKLRSTYDPLNVPVQASPLNPSSGQTSDGILVINTTGNLSTPDGAPSINQTSSPSDPGLVNNCTTTEIIPVPSEEMFTNSSRSDNLSPGAQNGTGSDGSPAPLIPIPGNDALPGDPDGDGLYEDLNGNGKIDLQDTTVFFTNIEWIQSKFPAWMFDFNKNGGVDLGDITILFSEASL
ncbi:MAG TPA: hypothetical protein VN372_05890 [Methanospirillum sp.]|nr:hypothetical protein [Methanospirillum sp.]